MMYCPLCGRIVAEAFTIRGTPIIACVCIPDGQHPIMIPRRLTKRAAIIDHDPGDEHRDPPPRAPTWDDADALRALDLAECERVERLGLEFFQR